MSTPQAIAFPAQRVRLRRATLLTALGVLAAIAVSVVVIALTAGGGPATAISPVTVSEATSGSVPEVHYLGSRQIAAAALTPQTTQLRAAGTTPTAGASNTVLHYTCLGAAARCLR
jgi:hypothetical protein